MLRPRKFTLAFAGVIGLAALSSPKSLSLAAEGDPVPTCTNAAHCDKPDFEKAARSTGCELLFVVSRYRNCIEARATLHTEASCGENNALPVCGREDRSTNKNNLVRLKKCLEDREKQQAAFKSGLQDVETARTATYANKKLKMEIVEYLTTIKSGIEKPQNGHAEQIRGVKVAIKNCEGLL